MANPESIDIDINEVPLEELIIVLGGVLYSGADLEEIDTPLLSRLEELIKAEIVIRENGMQPPKGEDTIH